MSCTLNAPGNAGEGRSAGCTCRKKSKMSNLEPNGVITSIGERGGGSRGRPPPTGLKNFRANSVFRASESCSKILNVKSILNTVKNFRSHSVFQGKRKLLKNPECKKIYSIQ